MTFFLIFFCFIFIFVLYLIPKNITKSEQYTIALFSILLGLMVDVVFDIKYHLYGYIYPGVQYLGFLPILIFFPVAGIVFINFYPNRKPLMSKLLYIIGWTIFSLVFEYISLVAGYFYYNGWKYLYSAFSYPFLLWLQLLHFKFLKSLNKNRNS
ncbi:CBO0543 family protein [Cytobacillus solani]